MTLPSQPMEMTMTTIELVSFRLKAGTDRDAFLQAAHQTEALIRRQPGFQTRMLTEDSDGTWREVVTWDSHDTAMKAAETVMSDPEFAPFEAMIDPATVTMSHSALVWQMD
jgi:hypothetical protein